MDATTRRLVDFACGLQWADLPPAAVHAGKARVLDSIGVAIAAFGAPPVRILRDIAPAVSGPWTARIWGSGARTTPDLAALVSGSMVRYLDLNDAYRTLDAAHPSDNLPGVMAVAEALGASGRDALLALAISYEIQCRFTDTVPFNAHGWDQPVSGSMAMAAAAGRLLGLDAAQMGNAIALAAVPHMATYQTRSGELSMWKGCAGPNGARHGIFAARMAQAGMTGPYDAFEGTFGLWQQGLGKPGQFKLETYDARGLLQTNIKRYAVRDSCQLPIDVAIALRAQIDPTAIGALRIETYKSAHLGAVADPELWRPQTRETADHSMLFSVAAGLLDGDVTPESFEEGRFLDPDITGLIGRMTVDIVDEFTKAAPAQRNCRITATLADGTLRHAHQVVTLEQIERGMPDAELVAKFRRLTRHHLPGPRRDAVIAACWQMDQASSVDTIIAATLL